MPNYFCSGTYEYCSQQNPRQCPHRKGLRPRYDDKVLAAVAPFLCQREWGNRVPLSTWHTIHQVAQVVGRTRYGVWTVVEHERPHQVILQMHGGLIEVRYAFVPIKSSTRVIRRLTYPSDFAERGLDFRALEQVMHEESAKGMQQLKGLVEEILPSEAAD